MTGKSSEYGVLVADTWYTLLTLNAPPSIIEAINLMPNNQMALHTLPGCTKTTPPNQMGETLVTDCSASAGCTVAETQANSFQTGFAQMGGGVWATQFDVAG